MTSFMGGHLDSTIRLMTEITTLTRMLISSANFDNAPCQLVQRTKEIIPEIEKLCPLFKKDCILFDDITTKYQVENVKLQDELLVAKKKCNDLREKLTRLEEDNARLRNDERMANERVKRSEERLVKDREEQNHLINKYSEMSSKLNVKVTQLNNQVWEKDQMINTCRERVKSLELEVARKGKEVNDLKHQYTVAYKSMEERSKNQVLLERDQILKACNEKLVLLEKKVRQNEQELRFKHEKIVAYENNEENLKNQVLERDKILSMCKEKINSLEGKVLQREQEVRAMNHQKLAAHQIIEKLTVEQTEADQNADELRRRSKEALENTEKFKKLYLAVERDKLKSDDELKDIKEKQLEAEKYLKKVKWTSLAALQAVEEFKEWTLAADESLKVNKERWEGLPRIKMVEEGLIEVLKIKVLDLANSVLKEAVDVDFSIREGGRVSLHMCTGIDKGSGNDDDDILDQPGSQFHGSPPQAETSSSANLEKETEKSHCSGIIVAEDTIEVPDHGDEARPGESENNSDLLVSLVPRRKRSSLGNTPNKRQKKEPTLEPSQENDKDVAATDSEAQIWDSSSDSDSEPYSDSHMNHMVRNIRFEHLRKTWKSESDMLKDFQKKVEVCMDAVCVLYRWKMRGSELPQFDAMGGCSLAKYLTDGDGYFRLRKFVSEVVEERPDSFVQCRKIARSYCEKLFSIYRSGNDSYFK